MTTINIVKNNDKKIESFLVTGHSGYAQSGSDIVCAGISATANMVIIGFEKLGIVPHFQSSDGVISCIVPNDLEEDISQKIQFLLECMVEGFRDIEKVYGKYVKIVFEKK